MRVAVRDFYARCAHKHLAEYYLQIAACVPFFLIEDLIENLYRRNSTSAQLLTSSPNPVN